MPADVQFVESSQPEGPVTLLEARRFSDAVVIGVGDYGAHIYFSCPVALVQCSDEELSYLVNDLDSLFERYAPGAGHIFDRATAGSAIRGGMGGGQVTLGVWCHSYIHALDLASATENVLFGKAPRLQIPDLIELTSRAKAGDSRAAYFLSRHSKDEKNYDEALRWLRTAATGGHLLSLSELSVSMHNEFEEQIIWTTELACQRDEDDFVHYGRRVSAARMRLANLFDAGRLVGKDLALSATFYLKCAFARYSGEAALRLGQMYYDGIGVEKDFASALLWLTLGMKRNTETVRFWSNPASKERRREAIPLLKELSTSSELIRIAEKAAQQFFPSFFKLPS